MLRIQVRWERQIGCELCNSRTFTQKIKNKTLQRDLLYTHSPNVCMHWEKKLEKKTENIHIALWSDNAFLI